MKRRDISWTLAVCWSLALHAGLLYLLLQAFIQSYATIRLDAPPKAERATTTDRVPLIVPETPEDKGNEMGESTGKGYASNASAGEDQMRAREGGEDQAYLSLDPVGFFGTDGSSAPMLPSMPAPPVVAPTRVASPFGVRASELDAIGPARPLPVRITQATTMPAEVPAEDPKPAPTDDAPVQVAAARAMPKNDAPPGDPAPLSDSESDPFSKIGSANFRPGAVQARFGRKVKTVRPRLTLAGQYDLAALQYPSVQLTVKIDETGKVTSADILRSSGSNQIDLPCQQAMYEWWIEPPKDKDGKPKGDVMVWLLSFR